MGALRCRVVAPAARKTFKKGKVSGRVFGSSDSAAPVMMLLVQLELHLKLGMKRGDIAWT